MSAGASATTGAAPVLPFHLSVSDDDLADLKARLARTRLADDFANDDWRYGVERSWLARALTYWEQDFDWRTQEAKINAYPQFRTVIDDIPVHFLHVRGKQPNSTPLILSHGWPWSFWDWHKMIGPLTDPGFYGAPTEISFDLVIPSLPGFGFSAPLRTTGVTEVVVANLWARLMTNLGYERFGAAGGDLGSFISKELALRHPERLIGLHMSLPVVPGVDLRKIDPAAYAADESWMREQTAAAAASIRSHVAVHSNDPQTLAYALNDSPAGLAAWIWERKRAWSDCSGDIESVFDLDFLCTTASIYWFSQTIGTSMRFYWERRRTIPQAPSADRISVPTGFAIGPKELLLLPRSLAEAHSDLRRWSLLAKGGHFLPLECSHELAYEYRNFFADLA